MSVLTDLAKTLADTPLPTVLVLAGLFFILLSLVDRLIERISIPEQRRFLSLSIGVALTLAGTLLWVLPSVLGGGADATRGHGEPAGMETTANGTSDRTPNAWYIQLAAVSSYGAALAAVDTFRAEHGEVLGELTPQIEPVDHPEHGTLYRVRFGVLKSAAEGDVLCGRLARNGVWDCRVFAGR